MSLINLTRISVPIGAMLWSKETFIYCSLMWKMRLLAYIEKNKMKWRRPSGSQTGCATVKAESLDAVGFLWQNPIWVGCARCHMVVWCQNSTGTHGCHWAVLCWHFNVVLKCLCLRHILFFAVLMCTAVISISFRGCIFLFCYFIY